LILTHCKNPLLLFLSVSFSSSHFLPKSKSVVIVL